MATYKFPQSTLDDRSKLLSLIGGFWDRIYDGRDLVASILFARAQEEKQTQQDFQEMVDSLSRFNVPVHHRDHWYQLRVLRSEVDKQPLRYGDDAVYGNQPDTNVLYKYGDMVGSASWRITLPEDLKFVPLITNRITLPSVTLIHGVDYRVDNGVLVINRDLFDDPDVPRELVYEGSEVVDEAISIWLFHSLFDRSYIYNHFGYLITGPRESTEDYRLFVNAVLDALAEGTTQRHLEAVFAALTGNPVAKGDETVEYVGTDRNHLLVLTDKNAYRFPLYATAVVSVGDALTAGQQMTDTVEFFDFTRGEAPEELLSLHLDKEYLVHGFAGGLTFPNKNVPLVVEENVNGKTKISFELGGYPTDVESFFDQLHLRSGELGKPTLAESLDLRGPGQATQPTAASLPADINPCEFLVANVLRFHYAAVKIKVAASVATDLMLIDARVLRKIVPPWQTLLILMEIDAGGESIDPTSAGTEDAPGVDEDGELVSAAEPDGDVIDPAVSVEEDGVLFYIECLCG